MYWFSRSFIRNRVISFVTTALVGVVSLALARGPVPKHPIRQTTPIQYVADRPSGDSEFLSENASIMSKMTADMTIKPTGDVDRDFVAMMVPHHQGAVEMARAVLRYGHNEQLRRIAQDIIATQQQEIEAMRLAVCDHLAASTWSATEATAASPATN